MIEDVKLLLAVLLFCVGIFLVGDLLVTGFNFVELLASMGCFALAHFIKPNTRDDGPCAWYEILDFIIEIPYKAIAGLIRNAGKSSKGDFDISDS